jgi:hypothetical protein
MQAGLAHGNRYIEERLALVPNVSRNTQRARAHGDGWRHGGIPKNGHPKSARAVVHAVHGEGGGVTWAKPARSRSGLRPAALILAIRVASMEK